MRVCVKLPSGSLVDYYDFCTAIAQAVCPAGEQGFQGIDCIVGVEGLVAHRVPIQESKGHGPWFLRGVQTALISEDGHTLDQLLPLDQATVTRADLAELPLADTSSYQVVETLVPFVMSEGDRKALQAVLPKLPPLHYPISDTDAEAFMDAYHRLSERPRWRPVLITEADIEGRQAEQAAARQRHQKAIQHEFHAGRLVAVDSHYVPVAALVVGALIPRDQAIAYLERCGFAHSDTKSEEDPAAAQPQELETSSERSSHQPSTVGNQKLTPKQREQLVAHHRKLQNAGAPDFVKQTAEKFGVSTKYVYLLAQAAEEAEQEQQSIGRRVIRHG